MNYIQGDPKFTHIKRDKRHSAQRKLLFDCTIAFGKCYQKENIWDFYNKHRNVLTLGITDLLFFAAYVICKKNYSGSRVVFLFYQTKIASYFYSKINHSIRVRKTGFSSSRFVVPVSVVPNIFIL